MATPEALPVSELRKVCDPESLDFDRSSELAELVGGGGGDADLANLALVTEFGQAAQRLGDRGVGVGTMELEVIDVVGVEPGEARLETLPDLGRIAAPFAVGERGGVPPLGRDQYLTPT